MKKQLVSWLVMIVLIALTQSCSKPERVESDLLECDVATITTFPYHDNGVFIEKHQALTPVQGYEVMAVMQG